MFRCMWQCVCRQFQGLVVRWRWRRAAIPRLKDFEKRIGFCFRDKSLLVLALKHRSYLHVADKNGPLAELDELLPDDGQANERLEFLGDAVLGLLTTDYLYLRFPRHSEGQLTKRKSVLVSKSVLAQRAVAIGLDEQLLLSDSEEIAGGRERRSILGDAYEALIGAMYLDCGLEAVRAFLERELFTLTDQLTAHKDYANYKSLLLEFVQGAGQPPPEYQVSGQKGPDHRKTFLVEVRVSDQILGRGEGRTKKGAQQQAAKEAYQRLVREETALKGA